MLGGVGNKPNYTSFNLLGEHCAGRSNLVNSGEAVSLILLK